ncbi:hypothetical protein Cadr_000025254 [Camelus dromedarius]|uniref:Uncharacterized protein n=1 Tax=Camelus dromedarius TaxID=9838 RepID=A0A5N4CME0_CAMDR|nr:hypothetical protein Cadr_000025254 [Camelus dromedarius]
MVRGVPTGPQRSRGRVRLVQRTSPRAKGVKRWDATEQLRSKWRRSRLMLWAAGEQMPTVRVALCGLAVEEQLVSIPLRCTRSCPLSSSGPCTKERPRAGPPCQRSLGRVWGGAWGGGGGVEGWGVRETEWRGGMPPNSYVEI